MARAFPGIPGEVRGGGRPFSLRENRRQNLGLGAVIGRSSGAELNGDLEDPKHERPLMSGLCAEGKLSDWAEGRRFRVLAGLAELGFEEELDGDRGRSADRYCDEQSRENGMTPVRKRAGRIFFGGVFGPRTGAPTGVGPAGKHKPRQMDQASAVSPVSISCVYTLNA